jgi:hypothetical protein
MGRPESPSVGILFYAAFFTLRTAMNSTLLTEAFSGWLGSPGGGKP